MNSINQKTIKIVGIAYCFYHKKGAKMCKICLLVFENNQIITNSAS